MTNSIKRILSPGISGEGDHNLESFSDELVLFLLHFSSDGKHYKMGAFFPLLQEIQQFVRSLNGKLMQISNVISIVY